MVSEFTMSIAQIPKYNTPEINPAIGVARIGLAASTSQMLQSTNDLHPEKKLHEEDLNLHLKYYIIFASTGLEII